MKLLSILIPTTPDREIYLANLRFSLQRQIKDLNLEKEVEILELCTEPSSSNIHDLSLTTGAKRNKLIEMAEGKYVAFVDSDDMVSDNYIALLWPGICRDVDCCSLIGQIYWNGVKGMPFYHSIKHKDVWQDDKVYYRPALHINCIKRDLIKDIKFEEKVFGEDCTWAMEISNKGLLKDEYEVNEVIYHYFVGFPKYQVL